jgi:hypothetical protein
MSRFVASTQGPSASCCVRNRILPEPRSSSRSSIFAMRSSYSFMVGIVAS